MQLPVQLGGKVDPSTLPPIVSNSGLSVTFGNDAEVRRSVPAMHPVQHCAVLAFQNICVSYVCFGSVRHRCFLQIMSCPTDSCLSSSVTQYSCLSPMCVISHSTLMYLHAIAVVTIVLSCCSNKCAHRKRYPTSSSCRGASMFTRQSIFPCVICL